jgi:hypothetical protein
MSHLQGKSSLEKVPFPPPSIYLCCVVSYQHRRASHTGISIIYLNKSLLPFLSILNTVISAHPDIEERQVSIWKGTCILATDRCNITEPADALERCLITEAEEQSAMEGHTVKLMDL